MTNTEQSSALAKCGWMPIESAPKDEPILLKYLMEGWEQISIESWDERFDIWSVETKNFGSVNIEMVGWTYLEPQPRTFTQEDVERVAEAFLDWLGDVRSPNYYQGAKDAAKAALNAVGVVKDELGEVRGE